MAKKISLEVAGPLIFWVLMFAVGAAIKFMTFKDTGVFIDLSPEVALWATGILFSLSVSEHTYSNAKLVSKYTKNNEKPGFAVAYDVTISDNPGFTPKFIYLFLIGMAVWIFCLLLSGYAGSASSSAMAGKLDYYQLAAIAISYLFAASLVGVALRSLYEITK